MTRRNIVVFVCDQLRADFLRPYGCDAIETPAIDWLASQGTTFNRAITQSTICGPARATMMTGRYVSDHGAWTNDLPWRRGIETIGERMTRAGYRTGCFGKMHHAPADDPKGFEFSALFEENRLADREAYIRWLKELRPGAEDCFRHLPQRTDLPEELHYEHWIGSQAIEFLQAPDERPSLAWISFQGPHCPFDPVDGMDKLVDGSRLPVVVDPDAEPTTPYRRTRAALRRFPRQPARVAHFRHLYARLIAQIDRQIIRVLRALEASGMLENTTFLFAADHGDDLGDQGLDEKGAVPTPGSLRIPLIVAGHPAVQGGMMTDALAGNIDLAGTLLDIAGDGEGLGHSRSLIDLAQAEPTCPRSVIVSEYTDQMQVVDSPDYRFVYYPFLGESELYALESDPQCRDNLACKAEFAPIVASLSAKLLDHAALCRGPHFNAYELVPELQDKLRLVDPHFEKTLPILYPLSARQHRLFRRSGLDANHNEFCRSREIIADYGTYWDPPEMQEGAGLRLAYAQKSVDLAKTLRTRA